MPKLRYFGPGGLVLEHFTNRGWDVVGGNQTAEMMIVETYENNKDGFLERLESTIQIVKDALDEIEHHQLKLFLVITDQSSVRGTPRRGMESHDGACLDGIHGFGSLTAETLARKAEQLGVSTRVLRTGNQHEKIVNLEEILESLDPTVNYRLISRQYSFK